MLFCCPGKTTHHALQGMARCRRCVRMSPGFEGPTSTFGEVAFSERGIPRSPVREVAPAETGHGPSTTVESTTITTAQQSARGSRSEGQCRSPTVGDGHFGFGGDEPTRHASGGSVADRQNEICSPSSPTKDSITMTMTHSEKSHIRRMKAWPYWQE